MSFGSEDEKIGIGFEMFNVTKNKEMNFEDFYESYCDMMRNWSLLSGERPKINKELIKTFFDSIDTEQKGVIKKNE